MSAAKKAFTPQQERSRATADRLISATIQILDEHGLEGAVIPKIADKAGVAHGSVYRRFSDKDALIRAACLYVLQRSNEGNRTLLKAALLRPSLEETCGWFLGLLLLQYRSHPKLLQALAQFVAEDDDKAFTSEAHRLLSANIDEIASVFLTFQSEIDHAEPRRALRFAILNAITSIRAIVFEPKSLWYGLIPGPEDALVTELMRAFISYLRGGPCTATIKLSSIDKRLRKAITLVNRSTPALD
jgi:AcrR family transcriptional regulator